MSLEDVLTCLSRSDLVSGVLQIGSLSRGQLRYESDYDLVIVLEQSAAPWYVGVTTIDRRFTDLIFVDKVDIEPTDSQVPIIRRQVAVQRGFRPEIDIL